MRNRILLLLSAVALSVFSSLSGEGRVLALLEVENYRQACQEAEINLRDAPQSIHAMREYITAFAKMGEERKALAAYKKFLDVNGCDDRELLEHIGWGIIEKASYSSLSLVRLFAALGAYSGQDARGVVILKRSVSDSNARIRLAAVELSSHFRDAALQEELLERFPKEKNPYVRVEMIKALGKMKISRARPQLVSILYSGGAHAEEKAAAIEALVNLMDKAKREEIKTLVSSQRAGLRELACQVIWYTSDHENSELLSPLLNDHCAEVRLAALQAIQPDLKMIRSSLVDPDPFVAIAAARYLTVCSPQEGMESLKKWMSHLNRDVRVFAAGALATTGKYGLPLMQETILGSNDPFIRVNAALGLIGQRKNCDICREVLGQFLTNNSDRIMWKSKGAIRYIAPSEKKLHSLIPNQPERVNQITRLSLLNLLAILEDPRTTGVARSFLQQRTWGISGSAAELLLTEGDEKAIECIEELLEDVNPNIRVQAAVISAFWEKSEKAVSVLQEAYPSSDRETKERILESIGAIGSESSIPFLVKALGSPSETLRIIAAASLINCLYH